MSNKIYTIEEIKNILNSLFKNYDVDKVILFGSYAKGNANINSDVDLVIDTDGRLMGFKLFSLILKIEELLKKDVDAFEKKEIISGSDFALDIDKTGIVIYEKQ